MLGMFWMFFVVGVVFGCWDRFWMLRTFLNAGDVFGYILFFIVSNIILYFLL